MSGDPKPAATLCCAPAVLPLVPGFARPPAERRPLPDAVAVRMLAIPDYAPPYDDELGTGRLPCLADGEPVQRRHEPRGRPLPAGQQPSRRQAADGPEADRPETDQRVAPAGQPPAPRPARAGSPGRGPAAQPGWPSQFAQVLAETLAGSRPQRQIAPWTTERARRHIQRLGPLLAAGAQPRVRRVVTFRPAADVVEMSVIVGVGPKVRALAIRLERDGPRDAAPGRTALAARWVCTAVEAA
jgi:hypothetical protein